MKHPRWSALLFAILTVGLLAGCGGSSEESGAAAVMEEATEAAKEAGKKTAAAAEGAMEAGEEMVDAALEDLEGLKGQLAEKEAELQKLTDELKGLSPADLMGDKAKDLKSRQEALMEQISALKEKLAKLGG